MQLKKEKEKVTNAQEELYKAINAVSSGDGEHASIQILRNINAQLKKKLEQVTSQLKEANNSNMIEESKQAASSQVA